MNELISSFASIQEGRRASASLSMVHLSPGEVGELPPHALGVVGFGRAPARVGIPSITIPMEQLAGEDFCEGWLAENPVSVGEEQGLHYADDGRVLFGALARPGGGENPDSEAYDAYRQIVRFGQQKGFPHFLRIWNHVFAINEEHDGLERYKRFSRGRYQALKELGYRFDGDLPAASATGLTTPGLWIYFIASKTPATPIENPRQVSAFHYPQKYGPRSPSFARGSVVDWPDSWQVFLSGTASIVGHETRHPGDVLGQLDETVVNMAAVMKKAATIHGNEPLGIEQLTSVKIYLRDSRDLDRVRERLEPHLAPGASTLWVEADICRRDLLLEIEGIADIPK